MKNAIEIIDLKKRFDEKWVTNGVNLQIPKGQMTIIIGRSGEGKSVLLKQIIGLIKPTSGHILIDGADITTLKEKELEVVFKKFGYVFQFAALLDSLNVFENIGITKLENGAKPEDVLPIVKEKLALVHLQEDTLYQYPSELSGGMKKRVGLARTLMEQPEVILYDEPTTGLDPITSSAIHKLMHSMHTKFNDLTSIVISHDLDIFKYADNVALLHEGQIKYFGPAKTAWESNDPYLYQFIRGLQEGPIHEVTYQKKRKSYRNP